MPRKRNNAITALAVGMNAEIRAAADRSVATLRRIRRAATLRVKEMAPADLLRLARRMLATEGVPKWWVYELVRHHRSAMASLSETHLRQLGKGLSSWGEVDAFACFLSGPAWREGQIGDQVVHRWATAADRWWRRAAVVSTVALNTPALGGRGDAPRTLAVCQIVKYDRDEMVVKAVSWALRALAKREPAAVRAFVIANADCLAARVIREVKNKLETGRKNPRAAARRGAETGHG